MVAPFVSFVLLRRDGDLSLTPEVGKQPRVVAIDRLLEPFNPIRLNALRQIQRYGKRKEIICIDHEFYFIPHRLTNCAHSGSILRRVLGAVDGHHHFKFVMSLGYKLLCRLHQLLASILEQAKGDVCGNSGTVSAQKFPYGLAEMLSLYDPQRDVQRADSAGQAAGSS